MKIGIDMDGVVIDTINFVACELSRYLKREIKPDEVAHNFNKIDNVDNIFEEMGDYLLYSLNPIENAVESINFLAQKNDVYIISARYHIHYDSTLKWIKKHGIKVQDVIFTEGKGKIDVCKEKGIGVFIEDSIKNAIDIAGLSVKVIILSTEYNSSLQRDDIIRCNNWVEIVSVIEEIKSGVL